jgi:uncharacterized membrane protein
MKKTLLSIWSRLNNTGTIAALSGAILIILKELGFHIDNEKIMNIVNAGSYILVILGILNDSTSKGMYIPFVNDKLTKPPVNTAAGEITTTVEDGKG